MWAKESLAVVCVLQTAKAVCIGKFQECFLATTTTTTAWNSSIFMLAKTLNLPACLYVCVGMCVVCMPTTCFQVLVLWLCCCERGQHKQAWIVTDFEKFSVPRLHFFIIILWRQLCYGWPRVSERAEEAAGQRRWRQQQQQ